MSDDYVGANGRIEFECERIEWLQSAVPALLPLGLVHDPTPQRRIHGFPGYNCGYG